MRILLLSALLAVVPSARADVSDSGNLRIGGGGVSAGSMAPGSISMTGSTGTFTSQSSVTASSFFGDGSHLTGVVGTSTGSAVFFSSSSNFQTTAISWTPAATVTGSTISFVVTGTTVACWMTGGIRTIPQDWIHVGVGVDGTNNKIGQDSGTGITTAYGSATSGVSTNMSFGRMQFQVAAGTSHTFNLAIWTHTSSTLTFPYSEGVGQFGCAEVK